MRILECHRTKEMKPATRDPLEGDKTTSFERLGVIVRVVDDKFHDFQRKCNRLKLGHVVGRGKMTHKRKAYIHAVDHRIPKEDEWFKLFFSFSERLK
jgi:hypothetical protein